MAVAGCFAPVFDLPPRFGSLLTAEGAFAAAGDFGLRRVCGAVFSPPCFLSAVGFCAADASAAGFRTFLRLLLWAAGFACSALAGGVIF